MTDENTIVRDRQKLIRREMDKRGISIKAVQLDGGWENSSTVLSYFPADAQRDPATMSVAALYRLAERDALPVDLLSLLLPAGFGIFRLPEEVDHDDFAACLQDYLRAKTEAHHPDSPGGREIAECEDAKLRGKAMRIVRAGA